MCKFQKHKKPPLIVFLLLALITPILGGCSMDLAGLGDQAPMLPENEARQARDDMLKHLNNKYGEQFKTNGLRSATTKQQSMDFWLASDKDENSPNWATCQRIVNDDGSIEYKDDWAINMFKPVYQQEVQGLAKNYISNSEYTMSVSISSFDPIPEDITSVKDKALFENWLKEKNDGREISICITFPVNSEEEIDFNSLTNFKEKLKTISYSGRIRAGGKIPEKWQKDSSISDCFFAKRIIWGYNEDRTNLKNDVWE